MMKTGGKHFYIAIAVLMVGVVLVYRVPHGKSMPLQKDLVTFESQIGAWRGEPPRTIDAETMAVLRVDNYLDRVYRNPVGEWISLYIGYFADQQSGQIIHSPKNCLPGAGWDFLETQDVTIPIPQGKHPPVTLRALRGILVNKDQRMLSYYWYQSRGRFLASEYWDKFYLVLDAIRYNRTDGALIRVLASLPKDADINKVDAQLKEFIVNFTPILQYEYFPAPVGS